MSSGLTVARAALSDADLVGRLHCECWRGAYKGLIPDDYLAAFTPERRAEKFRVFLQNPLNEHYIARVDNTPAGLLCVGRAHDEDFPAGYGEIHALYLLPPYWGRGYGRALMDFALSRLSALGYDRVSLWVLADNARARRFYEAAGFAADGKIEPITLGRELMETRYARVI